MARLLKTPVKLALIQLATTADKAHNLSHARTKVLEATKAGARIVVLPLFPQHAASSTSTATARVMELARAAWDVAAIDVVPDRKSVV